MRSCTATCRPTPSPRTTWPPPLSRTGAAICRSTGATGQDRSSACGLDRVDGDTGDPGDPALASRLRLSPVWTWFPTEYSKLRLQYNFDQGDAFERDEHSLWLQLEFLLGAHAAHKF